MRSSQQTDSAYKQAVSHGHRTLVAVVVCALFAACAMLSAQTNATGAISGTITDPTGAVIMGAMVRVTNMTTGDSRTLRSNDRGLYLAPLLQPGQYAVEVTKQGFKGAASRDVQVTVAGTTTLNFPLAPGAVTESVSVSSSNVQLETQSSELGRVTNAEMVEILPLVSRNYTQIIG
jgi:hypothetical protein